MLGMSLGIPSKEATTHPAENHQVYFDGFEMNRLRDSARRMRHAQLEFDA